MKNSIKKPAQILVAKSWLDGSDLLCECGNEPGLAGFDTCNSDGHYQEPIDGWEGHYNCCDCGRIFQPTEEQSEQSHVFPVELTAIGGGS